MKKTNNPILPFKKELLLLCMEVIEMSLQGA